MLTSPVSFVFVFCAHSQLAFGLRAAGDSQVAESIGDVIKGIDRQYESHFNHGGPGEASAFGQSMAAELQSQENVLVNPEVSRVIAEGNALAATQIVDDKGLSLIHI